MQDTRHAADATSILSKSYIEYGSSAWNTAAVAQSVYDLYQIQLTLFALVIITPSNGKSKEIIKLNKPHGTSGKNLKFTRYCAIFRLPIEIITVNYMKRALPIDG